MSLLRCRISELVAPSKSSDSDEGALEYVALDDEWGA
jgi:hypothetical protein